MARDTVALFISGEDGRDDQQLSIGIFIHHLHWTPPLILVVYSRGIQSATEILSSLENGATVLHIILTAQPRRFVSCLGTCSFEQKFGKYCPGISQKLADPTIPR